MGSGMPSISLDCAECGAALPTVAKFCLECGTPVSPGADRETRRTVTLLFTDVTGSTAMGEQLDDEAYRGVMGRYYAVARAAIERHGGTVEKFVGDAVLAVFGMPEIHEDDALRAVRAAHELNDAVVDLSGRLLAELGVRLAIRTGVNTGAVVAGSARSGGSFATGDAVNTAARLEQAAAPGEILMGATTYALVRDSIEAEAAEPVRAKGKAEPVPAYRLLGLRDAERPRRCHDAAVLVGRELENRVLDDAFEKTASSGHTHRLTVVGAAGLGKSRLVGDFVGRVGARAGVAQGRCLSYGQGITYWPLVQALRDALHLSGTESPEITRYALNEVLGRAPDADGVVGPLLALLGKAELPAGSEQTFWSVRRLVEELASRRPLVLCIDDLHWAEPTLLELIERLGQEVTDVPLLMVCQARPELLELHPEWDTDDVHAAVLRLEPLNLTETGVAVAAALGGDPPDGLVSTVADWSGGNPLFIEEIVTHLVESGVLQHTDRWQVTRPLDRAAMPPTVTALLASRLHRLPAGERDLLERMSVIGLEFETAQVETLVEPDLSGKLADLIAALAGRDLIRPIDSDHSETWAFKHVLVRDAAYDGMAKALRSKLHERFADALVAGAESGDELAGFVAHHLEQAARYRRQLAGRDPDTDGLVERAVASLVLAARDARDRSRFEGHAGYLVRALDLEPTSGPVRRRILAELADHQDDVMDLEHLVEVLDAFEEELDDTAGALDVAYLHMMRRYREMATGEAIDPAAVSATAQALVRLGRDASDPISVVRGLHVAAVCSAMLGLWRDASAIAKEIIDIGSPAEAQSARSMQQAGVLLGEGTLREHRDVVHRESEISGHSDRWGWAVLIADAEFAAASRSADMHAALRAAVARGDELYEAGRLTEQTGAMLIDGFAMARDLDGAIAYAQRVNDNFRRSGALGYASTYTLQQALLMLERGDPSETVLPLIEEAASHTSPYDAISVAYASASRAILAVRAADHRSATHLAEESLQVIDRTHQLWQQADIRRWLCAVPRATEDRARERGLLLGARERYHRKEIRSYDAEIQGRLAELEAQEI